ncbi:MAG: hypothetical protein ACO3BD_01025 [Chitinophagaceae bacterium]
MKFFQLFTKSVLVFNLMFLACMALRYLPAAPDANWVSVLVIGGWFLSFPANVILGLWVLILRVNGSVIKTNIIVLVNLLFLIFQLLYFILL